MADLPVHDSVSTFQPITFELSGEITTHQGPTRSLTLKMFKAGSFIRHGSPLIEEVDTSTNIIRRSFNYKAVMGFVQDATGIDQQILATIPGNDVEPLAYQILAMMSFPRKQKKSDVSASEASGTS